MGLEVFCLYRTSAVALMSSSNFNYSTLFFRRLKAIETERLPQVLTIQRSEGDVEEDDEEEEGFGFIRDDSCDEEHGHEEQGNSSDGASPDSCFQSLSPGEYSLDEHTYCCISNI